MKTAIGLCIAFALATTGAQAQNADKPLPVVAEKDRLAPGGRAVQMALPQAEIATTIDTGRIASAGYAGDVLSVIIVDAMDDDVRDTVHRSLHDKAEALAAPLRQALRDFDVASLALATTRAAVASPDWFHAGPVTASRDSMPDSTGWLMTDASQLAFIRYRYELSPDFSHIRVIAEVSLTARPGQNGRGVAPATLYRQRIVSIVQLRTRSYEPMENVALWSAENGKLARAALTAAFGQFERLIPYALGLGQKDIDALKPKNHPKAFAAGYYGPLVARDPGNPDDVLIWSNGLVHVQSAP